MRRTTLFLALVVSLVAVSRADVSYQVFIKPADKRLAVVMSFKPKTDSTELQLPSWAPGAYSLRNSAGRVKELGCLSAQGREVELTAKSDNAWTFASKKGEQVIVHYEIDTTVNDERLHFSGPSTYLYAVGQKDEKCLLTVVLPEGWKSYCGLDEDTGSGKTAGADSYSAPNYDTLADNPVSVGKIVTDSYSSHGVPHTIVYHTGDPTKLDRPKTVAMCKYVSDSEGDFFGGLPFKKYIWHFNVINSPSGGGGLEHLTSTEITLATGLSDSTQTVLAHEYFHAWNVKRIRSSVLGPFDYTQLPKTGALWWLEGVTDYYASLLTFRYGKLGEPFFFDQIVRNVFTTRSAPGRMEVSPYDSSFRVGEANNGRGNSSGYMVNYYNTGWLLGMCLDIELRVRSGGKRSLDEVVKVLWRQCRNDQPGFPEDGIRSALIQVGGAEMGGVYDKLVMKPGELPVEEALAKLGLQLVSAPQDYTDIGFDASPGQSGVRVRRVRSATELKEGDVLSDVNGVALSGASAFGDYRKIADAAKPGDKLAVKFKRGDMEASATVTVMKATRDAFHVLTGPIRNPDIERLREGWYRAGKKPIPVGLARQ